MKLVGFEQEERAEKWLRSKLQVKKPPDCFKAISAVDDRGYVCVLLTNFSSNNVDVNVAMERGRMRPKATLQMFNKVFEFVFSELGVRRATAFTERANQKAQRIIEKFGFQREGTMRCAAANGDDLIIYGFLAEDFSSHIWRRN